MAGRLAHTGAAHCTRSHQIQPTTTLMHMFHSPACPYHRVVWDMVCCYRYPVIEGGSRCTPLHPCVPPKSRWYSLKMFVYLKARTISIEKDRDLHPLSQPPDTYNSQGKGWPKTGASSPAWVSGLSTRAVSVASQTQIHQQAAGSEA